MTDNELIERITHCSAGEIVAASNLLNEMIATRPQPSVEEMVRAVVVAWLTGDHWLDEL